MVTNPAAAFALGASGNFPVTIDQIYANSDDYVDELVVEIQQTRIIDPGSRVYDYPHAGVLNSPSFLTRYPTTATNRNRARARWTYLHFLDIDIERSAPRTTDPVALEDTNNPTLYNGNCTVCHATLDPVAGAFQNYGDAGNFRIEGIDALDGFYKYAEDSPYQFGDTWYRDMRSPGILTENAPSNDNSLQWLASKIVQDPGFPRATVKFWWPAVFGADPLLQPEVESDANYAARLMAFDAQSASIQELADTFIDADMNLKDLIVDMVMSPWFRTASIDESNLDPIVAQAHELADLGSERLLTPEQLARKTTTLTRFTWDNRPVYTTDTFKTGMADFYSLYYGGIDSAGITQRARDMTALMSNVAMAHASESSCPIVLREFSLEPGQRALFNDIDDATTPLSENGETTIKEKLIELHRVLHGKEYALDSSEINLAYELFEQSWNEYRNRPDSQDYTNIIGGADRKCSYKLDINIGIGLSADIEPYSVLLGDEDLGQGPEFRVNPAVDEILGEAGNDPNFAKRAWITVMTYLLSHYDYLYE
jgi:hypothetical protein